MLTKLLKLKKRLKLAMSSKSLTSTQMLLRRLTTRTPSLKPEDKLQFKTSLLMVTRTESLLLTKRNQLLRLQLPLQ